MAIVTTFFNANDVTTRTVTGDGTYVLGLQDQCVFANATTGNIILQLPSAVNISGQKYELVRVDNNSGNNVTVQSTGGQTIGNTAITSTTISVGSSLILISDNSNWQIETVASNVSGSITGAASTIVSSNLTTNRAVISNSSGKIDVSPTTDTELSYLSGTSSNVQAQFTGKQATITGGASTIASANLTNNRALASDASGKVVVSATTDVQLGYSSNLTSDAQVQINGKQATITGAASSITSANLMNNRAVASDASGKVVASATTDTELGYSSGVTSGIQGQINGKQATITGAATSITSANLTVSRAVVSDSSGKVAVSATTSTQVGYLSNVTSDVQAQLNAKASFGVFDYLVTITGGTMNVYRASDGTVLASSATDCGTLITSILTDANIPTNLRGCKVGFGTGSFPFTTQAVIGVSNVELIGNGGNHTSGSEGGLTVFTRGTAIVPLKLNRPTGQSINDLQNFKLIGIRFGSTAGAYTDNLDWIDTTDFVGFNQAINAAEFRDVGVYYGNRQICDGIATANDGSGTNTDSTHIADSTLSPSWPVNGLQYGMVTIIAGTGVNQNSAITSNVAKAMTVSPAFGTVPDTTSVYDIQPSRTHGNATANDGSGHNTDAGHIADSVQTWAVNAYAGMTVFIYGGTGIGQTGVILSNTNKLLTMTANFGVAPDNTSLYTVVANPSFLKLWHLDNGSKVEMIKGINCFNVRLVHLAAQGRNMGNLDIHNIETNQMATNNSRSLLMEAFGTGSQTYIERVRIGTVHSYAFSTQGYYPIRSAAVELRSAGASIKGVGIDQIHAENSVAYLCNNNGNSGVTSVVNVKLLKCVDQRGTSYIAGSDKRAGVMDASAQYHKFESGEVDATGGSSFTKVFEDNNITSGAAIGSVTAIGSLNVFNSRGFHTSAGGSANFVANSAGTTPKSIVLGNPFEISLTQQGSVSGGGGTTVSLLNKRYAAPFTLASDFLGYVVTGVEWSNNDTGTQPITAGVDIVTANPPSSGASVLAAVMSQQNQAGVANAVQRSATGTVASQTIPAGSNIVAWISSSGAANVNSANVAPAIQYKSITYSNTPPNADYTAYTNDTNQVYLKIYLKGVGV